MARPSLPLGRLLPAALTRAAPGLAVLGVLAVAGGLAPYWAALGAVACIVIAALMAAPTARDLAALRAYGIALAREGDADLPELSGWAPAPELAATMGRIARQARLREQRLRAGMAASQRVFDSLPQPLVLIDDARRVHQVNRTARALIGTDPAGNDLAAAIRDPRVLETVDEVLADKQHRAVSLTLPDPVERFFSVEIVPFAEPAADGATVLVALYDLTERRRAEQMRADFIANASHELRTPLATLIGFIETLSGPARDDAEARDKFLGLMHEQATRMARLVKDLLSLSEIELGEHAAPETPTDLGAVIGRVVAALQIEAQKKDMTIEVEAGPSLPAVAGDADQLSQLFQNLVDNAIKYGRPGSRIRVTLAHDPHVPAAMARALGARPVPGVVRAAVIDQGEGIPARHIPRLTERFYRVDTARSRAVGGTGLGLAIVKHIVNRHRGMLDITSTEGVGSSFAVALPEAPQALGS